MKHLIFFSNLIFLFCLASCSKSETELELDNPLEAFIGEWTLVSEVSDGVEVNILEPRLMAIGDNFSDTDQLGYLNWVYPNSIDSVTLQIFDKDERMEFWRGGINWVCHYEFMEQDHLVMVDSFPGGPIVSNFWARIE